MSSHRDEQIREFCQAAKCMSRATRFIESALTAEQVKQRLLSECRDDAERRELLTEIARRQYRRRNLTASQQSVSDITEEDYVASELISEGLDSLPYPSAG